jgi:hypothetical protein
MPKVNNIHNLYISLTKVNFCDKIEIVRENSFPRYKNRQSDKKTHQLCMKDAGKENQEFDR